MMAASISPSLTPGRILGAMSTKACEVTAAARRIVSSSSSSLTARNRWMACDALRPTNGSVSRLSKPGFGAAMAIERRPARKVEIVSPREHQRRAGQKTAVDQCRQRVLRGPPMWDRTGAP